MAAESDALAARYRETLSELPAHWLDKSRSHEPNFSRLSGLFLPGTSQEFLRAPCRIMVVGRETKKWDVLRNTPFIDLDDYVQRAMATHQKYLQDNIAVKKDKGASFFNLLRSIGKQHGTEGVAYANLYAFSWGKSNPAKWKEHFPTLLKISKRLLHAQVEVLKPDVIVFANGVTSRSHLQEIFPYKGSQSVCTGTVDFESAGYGIRSLRQFDLHGKIRCYLIHHPSSTQPGAAAAQNYLLKTLLPLHVSKAGGAGS